MHRFIQKELVHTWREIKLLFFPNYRLKEIQNILERTLVKGKFTRVVLLRCDDYESSTILGEAVPEGVPAAIKIWQDHALDSFYKKLVQRLVDKPHKPQIIFTKDMPPSSLKMVYLASNVKSSRTIYLHSDRAQKRIYYLSVNTEEEKMTIKQEYQFEWAVNDLKKLMKFQRFYDWF